MNKKLKVSRLIIIFILLTIFNFFSLASQTKNWSIVDRAENIGNNQYFSLKCADSLNCIVLGLLNGYGGFFIRSTTNGGQSWEYIYMDSSYYNSKTDKHTAIDLYEIEYPNPNLMIAIGDSGLILRSTNKGDSWEKFYFDDVYKLYSINMYDSNYGICGTCTNECNKESDPVDFETKDGGISWVKMNRTFKKIPLEKDIINPNLFLGANRIKNVDSIYEQKLIWVRDSWKSWDTVQCPTLMYLDFITENYGWICSSHTIKDSAGWTTKTQIIYHTDDGGKTWDKQRDTVFGGDGINGIKFYDENFGMATGWVGLVLVTTNGGKKWKEDIVKNDIPNGSFFMMQSVQILSNTTAFVIADGKYIYKYTRDWTDVVEEKTESDFEVSPNPATDFIDIAVGTRRAVSEQTEIRIYNVLGEIQTTPSLRDTPPWKGGEKVKINVSTLAPGMYFVRIGDKVSKFIKM